MVRRRSKRTWRDTVVAVTLVVAAGLLYVMFERRPDRFTFAQLAYAYAGVLTLGALLSGRLAVRGRRGFVGPIAGVGTGVVLFAIFFAGRFLAMLVPPLDDAAGAVLDLPLLPALAGAVADELFFRGAVWESAFGRKQVWRTTVLYAVVTAFTGNVALVVAAVVAGLAFALQRRSTKGVVIPALTHLTWSVLMLTFVPA